MYEKLEFLLALAPEKHFGRAAPGLRRLAAIFPPRSNNLESILGVPLVDRGARLLSFTRRDERVLEVNRALVGDTRAMRAEVRQ